MPRDIFSFSDPEILRVIHLIELIGEHTISSGLIPIGADHSIEFSLNEKMPKPRPPLTRGGWEWRIRVWSSSPLIVVGAAIWDNKSKIEPHFVKIDQGMWNKCSESEMREFLMKKSDRLAEWFLWNMV